MFRRMLICFFLETLGEGCAFVAVLLVVFQWTSEAARPLERKVAAVGSSVLLPAPDNIKDIKFIQWEYLNGTTSHFIVQYYVESQKPTLYPPYENRVVFYSPNGSLLLEKLQETDSGVYKVSINLIESEARTTLLKVLRPVSQPQIWSNSSLAGSPTELFCNVPEGTVENIAWEKEGGPLPQERCYLLSENDSVLHIGKGEKSDCGFYSCNVSNEISWQESSLNLTIVGISLLLELALKISAVALVFALVSGMGFFILCCQSGKQRITGENWRWMIIFIQGMVCVSSVLLFAATVLWMQEEGQRIILDSAAPGAVILVVLFASLLLQKISQLQDRGCSQIVDLTGYAVTSAVISLLGLLTLFMWYHRSQGDQRENKRHSKGEADQELYSHGNRVQAEHCNIWFPWLF
ncbi:cell surface A33 antigen-like isoform X5 [Mauremys reevesii]|uniref:cell surface A33 antigen-like isoform X5 n=1 Tax=Mauremys reevesii TaxID=260615 RepID=UPI001940094B|nr:cell surface A33 antigen-like isoform X5 [Mauremys reevesii]